MVISTNSGLWASSVKDLNAMNFKYGFGAQAYISMLSFKAITRNLILSYLTILKWMALCKSPTFTQAGNFSGWGVLIILLRSHERWYTLTRAFLPDIVTSIFCPSKTRICWNFRRLMRWYTLPCALLLSNSIRPLSVPINRFTPHREAHNISESNLFLYLRISGVSDFEAGPTHTLISRDRSFDEGSCAIKRSPEDSNEEDAVDWCIDVALTLWPNLGGVLPAKKPRVMSWAIWLSVKHACLKCALVSICQPITR